MGMREVFRTVEVVEAGEGRDPVVVRERREVIALGCLTSHELKQLMYDE
jgi:hypothetical protein